MTKAKIFLSFVLMNEWMNEWQSFCVQCAQNSHKKWKHHATMHQFWVAHIHMHAHVSAATNTCQMDIVASWLHYNNAINPTKYLDENRIQNSRDDKNVNLFTLNPTTWILHMAWNHDDHQTETNAVIECSSIVITVIVVEIVMVMIDDSFHC